MKRHSFLWGLFVLGGGLLLLAHALGIGNSYGVVPILGSFLLILFSIMSFTRMNFVFGLVPLSLVTLIWQDELGISDVNPWLLMGSAVILGIGLSIIFHKSKSCRYERVFSRRPWMDHAACSTSSDEGESVNIESTFGDQVKYVRSTDLKSVKIDSSFSSVKVYFDQCQVNPEGATIFVDCSFSGVFLYIPRTWNIENKAKVFAGSVEGASTGGGDFIKVTLVGDVNFGSVKIIYV